MSPAATSGLLHLDPHRAESVCSAKRATMMPIDGNAMSQDEQAAIAVIADALREKFGDRALAVARGQAISADGDAQKTWSAIVDHLAER